MSTTSLWQGSPWARPGPGPHAGDATVSLIAAHNEGMNNFESLHPRAGGTGKNRTQFAYKQHSDKGLPTIGAGPDLRVVMRGEEAVVMSVAREDDISLLGDARQDRPLNPIAPEERAHQEAFNQQLQEAQEEFDRSRAKAAWALGEPSQAETGAGPGTRVVMRGEEAVVMSVATEPSISLSDELSKPRPSRFSGFFGRHP